MLWALVIVAAAPLHVSADGAALLVEPQLELKLTTLCRGACVELGRPSVERAPNGTTTLRYPGGVTEAFTPTPHGIEQTFVLQGGPMCHGDVTLELEAKGLPYLRADARGHLFGVPGSRGAHYSDAFVVRPRGQKLRIAVDRTPRGLRITVPAALADGPGAWPMVIDPIIVGVELPLDAPQALAAEATHQMSPRVASAGGNFFAVWRDGREGDLGIYGTRLVPTSASASPFTPLLGGKLASVAAKSLALAGLSANGKPGYWLVWEGQQPVSGMPALTAIALDVYGDAGVALNLGTGATPQLSCVGADCLAVWDTQNPVFGAPAIVGRRLPNRNFSGNTLGPAMLMVDGGYSPAIAPMFDNSGWVMVWVEATGTGQAARAAFFGVDGGRQPSDGGSYLLGVSGSLKSILTPTVAASQYEYLAAWHTLSSTGVGDIEGAVFAEDGTLITPTRVLVANDDVANPVVSRDANRWVLLWEAHVGTNGSVLKYARYDTQLLTSAGQRLTTRSLSGARETLPSLAHDRVSPLNDDHWFVAYELDEPPLPVPDVNIVHWSVLDGGSLSPLVDAPLGIGRNQQRSIAATALDTGFFAAWVDSRTLDHRAVFGARYAANGMSFSPPSLLGVEGRPSEDPAVAAIGDTVLVAFLEPVQSTVSALLIPPVGTGTPVISIAVANAPVSPTAVAVAAGTAEFLVVWTQGTGGTLHMRRFNGGGSSPDALPIPISSGAARPTAVFDGKRYLLAWETFGGQLQTAFFDPQVASVTPGSVMNSALEYRFPQLASNRHQTSLLVWCERNAVGANSSQWDVKALVLDGDARAMVGDTPLSVVDGLNMRVELPQRPIAAQGDGHDYVVALERGSILLREVSFDGTLRPIGASATGVGRRPALAIAPGGSGLVFYDRFSPQEGTSRGYFATLTIARDGGTPGVLDGGSIDAGLAVPPPVVSLETLEVDCMGRVDQTLAAGGVRPITWTIDDAPKGLTLERDGHLTWSPPFSVGGTDYHFTVHATNAGGDTTADLALHVNCPDQVDFSTRACACGSTSGLLAVLAALAVVRRRRS